MVSEKCCRDYLVFSWMVKPMFITRHWAGQLDWSIDQCWINLVESITKPSLTSSQFYQNTPIWGVFLCKNKLTAYISVKYLYGKYTTNYRSRS